MAKFVYIAVVLLFLPLTNGAASPAGIPDRIESPAASGGLPPQFRTVMGLRIGKHSLRDVQARYPEAKVFRLSDSDGASKAICLRGSTKNDHTEVVFEAGPLGGFETLTAATVGPAEAFPRHYNCASSSLVTTRAASVGHLKLGGDLSRVAKTLGTTLGITKSGLAEIPFERSARYRDPKTNELIEAQVLSGIVADIESDKIRWFSIYFVEGT